MIAKRFEPALRAQAIKYLQDRFHSEVEIGALHINRPKMSTIQILLRHGRGAIVAVEGRRHCHAIRRRSQPAAAVRDQESCSSPWIWEYWFAPKKSVNFVSMDGMEINVPPKDERHELGSDGNVQFRRDHFRMSRSKMPSWYCCRRTPRASRCDSRSRALHLQSIGPTRRCAMTPISPFPSLPER